MTWEAGSRAIIAFISLILGPFVIALGVQTTAVTQMSVGVIGPVVCLWFLIGVVAASAAVLAWLGLTDASQEHQRPAAAEWFNRLLGSTARM